LFSWGKVLFEREREKANSRLRVRTPLIVEWDNLGMGKLLVTRKW
jgi:hypothetical protein